MHSVASLHHVLDLWTLSVVLWHIEPAGPHFLEQEALLDIMKPQQCAMLTELGRHVVEGDCAVPNGNIMGLPKGMWMSGTYHP